jgi:NitT/TauT family transport system substrate-binding protein
VRRAAGLGLAGLLVLALVPGPARALDKIAVIHSSVSGSQAVLFVTRDARLFEKHGLEVDIRFVAGGSVSVQSMLAGEVQVAVMGAPVVVTANLKGADLAIIMGLINTLDHVVFASASLKRPEDLKGKRVGVARFASLDDFAARLALARWGLVPERDVAFIQLGEQGARLAALKAGAVDATLIQPPLTTLARKQGFHELAALADLGIDYLGTSVVTRQSLIKSQDDLIRRFTRALVEGIHFYKTNQAASLATIGRFMKLDDPEALEETYRQYALKLTPRAPYPSLKGVQTILDAEVAREPRAKAASPADFVEPKYVRELEESGFIKTLYGR